MYLFKGYVKKKASSYFYVTVLFGHPFDLPYRFAVSSEPQQRSLLCALKKLVVGSPHLAVWSRVRFSFTVSESFTGICEMSNEIHKLNNDMEVCLLLPYFLTVLVLLESLCASSTGASPCIHSLVYTALYTLYQCRRPCHKANTLLNINPFSQYWNQEALEQVLFMEGMWKTARNFWCKQSMLFLTFFPGESLAVVASLYNIFFSIIYYSTWKSLHEFYLIFREITCMEISSLSYLD